jgi:hypothetical protein
LERLLPRQWAKPEVLVAIQNNVQLGGNGTPGGIALEQLVLADLEFAKLRENPNYAHRQPEARNNAREVEASVSRVPPDLAGHLTRSDKPGSMIVSESQARESRRKVDRAEAKVDALFAQKQGGALVTQRKALKELQNGTMTDARFLAVGLCRSFRADRN